MVDIETLRQQTLAAKELVERKRQEAMESERRLNESRALIERKNLSQQGLRQAKDIQGRVERRQAIDNLTKLRNEIDNIRNYGRELQSKTQELESQEQQIRSFETRDRGYSEAQRWYNNGMKFPLEYLSPEAREYAQDLLDKDNRSRENFQKEIQAFAQQNPTEKLIINPETNQVQGIQSEIFQRTLSVKDYNQLVEKYNQQGNSQDISSLYSSPSRILSAQSTQRDISSLKNIPQSINPQTGRPFGTVTEFRSPSISDRFRQFTKDNIVGGSLAFLGNEARRQFEKTTVRQVMGQETFKDKFLPRNLVSYQQSAQGNLIQRSVENVPYFIPGVGQVLLVSGGTERIIRDPTTQGKLIGGAELGLGLAGIRSMKRLPGEKEVLVEVNPINKANVRKLPTPTTENVFFSKKEIRLDNRAFALRRNLGIGKIQGFYNENIKTIPGNVRRGIDWISGKVVYTKNKVWGSPRNLNAEEQAIQRELIEKGKRPGGFLGLPRNKGQRIAQIKRFGKDTLDWGYGKAVNVKNKIWGSPKRLNAEEQYWKNKYQEFKEIGRKDPYGFLGRAEVEPISARKNNYGLIGLQRYRYRNAVYRKISGTFDFLGSKTKYYSKKVWGSPRNLNAEEKLIQNLGKREGGLLGTPRDRGRIPSKIRDSFGFLGSKTKYYSRKVWGSPKSKNAQEQFIENLGKQPGGLLGKGTPFLEKERRFVRQTARSIGSKIRRPFVDVKNKVTGRINQGRDTLEVINRAIFPRKTFSRRSAKANKNIPVESNFDWFPEDPKTSKTRRTVSPTVKEDDIPKSENRGQSRQQLLLEKPTVQETFELKFSEAPKPSIKSAGAFGSALAGAGLILGNMGKTTTQNDLMPSTITKVKNLLNQKATNKPPQRFLDLSTTKQNNNLDSRQNQNQRQEQIQRNRENTKEKARKFIALGNIPKSGRKISRKEIIDNFGFDIFVRRKGKDIKVGTAKSEREAFGKLFGGLRNSLAASGFVSSGGRRVAPKIFDWDFGTSKRDITRVVQKRGFRLGSFSERREIQSEKKRKKLKWW